MYIDLVLIFILLVIFKLDCISLLFLFYYSQTFIYKHLFIKVRGVWICKCMPTVHWARIREFAKPK